MEAAAALLRSTQIKKRLAGVTAVREALDTPSASAAAADPEWLAATLVPDLLPCLRDHNFKVAMTALEILARVLPRVPETAVRGQLKPLWAGVLERLGDSKLPVREAAVEVVVVLADVLGLSPMLDRVKPCVGHKNWRTREQALHAIWRLLERHQAVAARKHEVLDDIVRLLDDSAKEVRDSAMLALEALFRHLGPALMDDLESKNIRAGHMKSLADRFAGASSAGQMSRHSSYNGGAKSDHAPNGVSMATGSSSSSATVEPMSATARFLSSIKNNEYTFERLQATTSAASGGVLSTPAEVNSSTSVSDATQQSDPIPTSGPPSFSGLSDRDIQREIAKIADGLQLSKDWSIRVESLKSLQRLAHKCNASDTALAGLSQGFRSIREIVCEQVPDLRSSVAREACQTLQTLARVLKDDFNAHAEYCIGNLMKATYVTILVISTSADASIRGIIESTMNGYSRMINKFIDGAKSRNQVLRTNCVGYLTLTLERWNAAFLNKHLDMFVQILPMLLHDALAEVRAQARKCFWALYRLFPQDADDIMERLDTSTQKNLHDDLSRYASANDDDGQHTKSTRDSRKSAIRMMMDASAPTSTKSEPPLTTSLAFAPPARVLPPASSGGDSATSKAGQIGHAGARRVLGSGATSTVTDTEPRSAPVMLRAMSQGALRVGLTTKPTGTDDASLPSTSSKSLSKPLRVPKPAEPLFTSRGEQSTATPAPSRAQRVHVSLDITGGNESSSPANLPPVPRRDRPNTVKRRAVTPEAAPQDKMSPQSNQTHELITKFAGATTQDVSLSGRVSKAPPMPIPEDGMNEALVRIENGLWSVRLEAVELIDRNLEKSKSLAAEIENGREKKVDERVLLALIRHLSDPHYRVAQASLKSLHACLQVTTQQQVAPFIKTILPRLFQKLVDPKESTRSMARDILQLLASTYDSALLINQVIQQLTDGTNMKMRAAVCQYLKQLLPGAREYFHQSTNNNNMRFLLAKIAQVLEADAPHSVVVGCGDLLQVASSLYGGDVEASIPLLAPTKRSTLARLFRSRGITMNVPPANPEPSEQSSVRKISSSGSTSSTNQSDNVEQLNPPSRKRQAQSPLKLSGSPQLTSRKENQQSSPVVVNEVDKAAVAAGTHPQIDPVQLDKLAKFATMISNAGTSDPSKDFEDVLTVLSDNNSSAGSRISALYKTTNLIKTESDGFWNTYFPRLLSVLLEAASERDVNSIRVLQRLLHAQPQRTDEFLHPIILGLLESLNGQVDLAAHLAESALLEAVRASSSVARTLDLLLPIVSSREPPVLQTLLRLVQNWLDLLAKPTKCRQDINLGSECQRLLPVLASKLGHPSSDVRKRVIYCLVSLHVALHDEPDLVTSYLSAHVDPTNQRLFEIFVDRRRSERASSTMECSE